MNNTATCAGYIAPPSESQPKTGGPMLPGSRHNGSRQSLVAPSLNGWDGDGGGRAGDLVHPAKFGRKWVVLHSPPPSTTTRRRIITMMLSQFSRFAKRLWARLSTAANQLFRHLTQPASTHLVTGT